jgi:hypothetical protein
VKVIALSILIAAQAPGGGWEAKPLGGDDVSDSSDVDSAPAPISSTPKAGAPMPVLTWQKERELESAFRQGLVRLYLDLLGDPNDYRDRYHTSIPNDVNDWGAQRAGVRNRLWSMRAEVDKKAKTRSGMPEATLRRMIANKQDFRPEHLRLMMHKMPRVDDVVVTIKRIQPLGGDNFRVDYKVEMRLGAFSRTTHFQAVDAMYDGGKMKLPMRVLADVSLWNERDIFGNAAPAFTSLPAGAGAAGGGGLLASILSGSILLDLFNF